ncbi:glypican-3 [Protopterus annectens]|uniref:glypican-3 n=1 Tax=Protopterus annectens TaxID=7888 RepID=UPI001CFBE7C9|nr:glypican-3 [Protopterus annectens]
MFRNQHRNNAKDISEIVGELFTDISLYILGSDLNVNNMINEFFDSLFPIMYRQLVNSGFQDLSGTTGECLRIARKDVKVFGGYPNLIMTRVSKSLQTARVFLQALNLGIEVINTTDHLKFTKDCGRALLKMWYCPHCQGLLMAKPCLGYCSSTMQSCLSSVTEIQYHWKEYIRSLEALANSMHGTYDVEHVLLNLHSLIKNAVVYAQKNGGKLSTTIKKICGHTWRRQARSTFYPVGLYVDQKRIKHSYAEHEETLSKRRREFINKLKTSINFYATLPHQLCSGDYAIQNDSLCWNGQGIVERYVYPVLKNTAKAQTSSNSDAKGKGREPVVNQIIDKLKHINQLLKGIAIPRMRTGNKDMGSTEGDVLESGDCDDEDECGGSGNGGFKIQQQPWFSSELPDELFVDDINFHKQLLTPQRGNEVSSNTAGPRYAFDYVMHRSLTMSSTSFLTFYFLFH